MERFVLASESFAKSAQTFADTQQTKEGLKTISERNPSSESVVDEIQETLGDLQSNSQVIVEGQGGYFNVFK